MKKVIVYLSALILGTVVVFGGTKGDVGGPGTICGGSPCTTRVLNPDGSVTPITVPCTKQTNRAEFSGKSNESGSLCGKCDFGGGHRLDCGSVRSGKAADK